MPPLSIMIKPASSLCNMRCKYCFYNDVASTREDYSFGVMKEATAYNLIEKALRFADGESVYFAFQGGEPLIAGLDYFKFFTKTVKALNTKNSSVQYGLQTNGTLLSDDFCKFFHENHFLVGLSLDGDFKNNSFRVDEKRVNAHRKIMLAAGKLKKFKVDFNILTVLTGSCADHIEEIYAYFKKEGFRYLQFIPCLRPFGDKSESELYMTAEQYENYLIKLFKLYVRDYMRNDYVSVRYFDNIVRISLGQKAEQCGLMGYCSHQFVIEGNGNVYPCDFYCTDKWLLGNINSSELSSLAKSEKAEEFIRESLSVPEKCKTCSVYKMCRAGGCKRNREDRDYCAAYKNFYKECSSLFTVFRNEGKA